MADLIVKDGKTRLVDPVSGIAADVAPEEAGRLMRAGYRPEDEATFKARVDAERYDSPARAFAAGALRGATVGVSDLVLPYLGVSKEELRKYEEYSPGWSTGGEIGGTVLTALVPGGPVGAAGKAASRGTQALGRAGQMIARSAAEGAVVGLGSGVSDVALGHEDEVFKALVGEAAMGALTGGLFGVGAEAAGMGLRAVDRVTRPAREALGKRIKGFGALKAEREALEAKVSQLGTDAAEAEARRLSTEQARVSLENELQNLSDAKEAYVRRNKELRSELISGKGEAQLYRAEKRLYAAELRAQGLKAPRKASASELWESLPDKSKQKFRDAAVAGEYTPTVQVGLGATEGNIQRLVRSRAEIMPEIAANEAALQALDQRVGELYTRAGGMNEVKTIGRRVALSEQQSRAALRAAERELAKLSGQQSPIARFVSDAVGGRVRQLVGFGVGGVPGAVAADLLGPAVRAVAAKASDIAPAVGRGIARGAKAAGRAAPAAVAMRASQMTDDEYVELARDINAISADEVEIIGRGENSHIDPAVLGPAVQAVRAGIEMLKERTKQAAMHDPVTARAPYRPTLEEKRTASRIASYIDDPDKPLAEFRAGEGTPEGVEFLQRTLPDILAKERQVIETEMRRLVARGKIAPEKVVEQANLLRGLPSPGLKNPETVAVLQEIYSGRRAQEPPQRQRAPSRNYSRMRQTEYQRLLEG